MQVLLFLVGIILILFILVDAFTTVVLPRQVSSRARLTSLFYRNFWALWSSPMRGRPDERKTESYLAIFGPLSLILLLALWELGLIIGFALILAALPSPVISQAKATGAELDLYTSASSLFSIAFGDITPHTVLAHVVLVLEGAAGLAFLALVIGYLPSVYQAFSQREKDISQLDARAGSPPTAYEMLRRCAEVEHCVEAREFLLRWEDWSADFLETHLSYPVLGFYRSQHENQSWLAALTVILDTSALVSVIFDGLPKRQGSLTFAMARHTIVDLAQVFHIPPRDHEVNRLAEPDFERMRQELSQAGVYLQSPDEAYEKLSNLRQLYEPYLAALANYFLMPIPGWFPKVTTPDNWQTTAWNEGGQIKL